MRIYGGSDKDAQIVRIAMMLSLAAQLAVRAVLDLAVTGPGHTSEIARRREIPPAQAGKIIQQLVRGGIVQTSRGARGGVRLARAPQRVTLRHVIEAIEGPTAIARCQIWDDCPCAQPCPVRVTLNSIQQNVENLFASVTLADLAAGNIEAIGPTERVSPRSLRSTEPVQATR
ncbi:MAG: RrF2 family transcriptional regulator [bacterium]